MASNVFASRGRSFAPDVKTATRLVFVALVAEKQSLPGQFRLVGWLAGKRISPKEGRERKERRKEGRKRAKLDQVAVRVEEQRI